MSAADQVGSESKTRRQAIEIAQIELFCKNLPGIIVGSGIAALVMVFATSATLSLNVRIGWFLLVMVLSIVRLRHLAGLRARPVTAATLKRRQFELTLFSALAALSWGVLGFIALTPDSLMQSVVVITMITAMVASGSALISHLSVTYVTFVLLILGPVVARCLMLGGREFTLMGLLLLIFMAVSWFTSRASAENVVGFIKARFDNLDQYTELLDEKYKVDEGRERAEAANAAKSQFLSSASHDLRQPLHSLRLFSATLQSRLSARMSPAVDGEDDELVEDHRLVTRIDESVTALEELFEGILDLSRLDAGTVDAKIEDVSLAPIFEHLKLAHAPAAIVKGVSWHDNANDAVVRTDPVMLERLLTNLVSNALRYTRSGAIHLRAETHNERVSIRVIDTGIGIPKAEHARIFQEFVQLDNPERDRQKGIGLGLSIVKRLASLLRANVRIESNATGAGTCFVVDVAAGDANKVAPVSDAKSSNKESLAGLFILVIDDDESARLAMEALMHNWDCTVMVASSADEAVQALEEINETPDIIISDYRLRAGETGTQAIAKVCAQTQTKLPALLITGDVDAHRLRDINESGLPVLHKPCRPAELKSRICDLTNR